MGKIMHKGEAEGEPRPRRRVQAHEIIGQIDETHTHPDLATDDHAHPDGPGSGLDADTLDGVEGSGYATSGHGHDADYVNEVDHTKAQHDALGIDADTVDGSHASAFATSGHNHDPDYLEPGEDAASLGSGAATDGHVLTADGAGGSAWEAGGGGGGGGGAQEGTYTGDGTDPRTITIPTACASVKVSGSPGQGPVLGISGARGDTGYRFHTVNGEIVSNQGPDLAADGLSFSVGGTGTRGLNESGVTYNWVGVPL